MESPGISAVARVATVGLYTPVLTEGTLKFDFDADGLDVRDLTVTGPGVNGAIDGARGRIGFDGQINLVVNAYFGLGIPGVDQALHVMQLALPSWSVTGTLRNPNTPVPYRLAGAKPLKKEPQPAGDLAAPAHDPW
jgi:hypothetical protein